MGLVVHDMAVRFGTGNGLQHISLAVAPGERVALLGPSGVGKTTLLRGIAGLDRIERGSVHVRGSDITHALPERRGIVYLHQSPSLFPHLTVLDNVGFPLEVRGVARGLARERARELLQEMQLAEFADRPALALSGGQRHRVALARALAADPAVLLLDEPFTALDPALRSDVRDAVIALLRGAHRPSVVVVTHDVDEAALLADRIAVLLDGRIAQDATPSVVLSRPASIAVARFIGIPNIVPGVCDARGVFRCVLGAFTSHLPAGPATLVARADAIQASVLEVARDVALDVSRDVAGSVREAQGVAVFGVIDEVLERVGGTLVRVRVEGAASDATVLATPIHTAASRVGERVRLTVMAARAHILPMSSNGTPQVAPALTVP